MSLMMMASVMTCVNCSGVTVQAATASTQTSGKWIKSGTRWWYRHSNGSYTKNGWEKISGKWYYFDKSGWMLTGWISVKGTWYYLNSSGAMTTGWQKIKNKWYYLNSNGSMAKGWKKLSNKWYYLNPNGDMVTGWKTVGGKKYYFNSSGVMLTGTQKIGNTTYKFDSSGALIVSAKDVQKQVNDYIKSKDGYCNVKVTLDPSLNSKNSGWSGRISDRQEYLNDGSALRLCKEYVDSEIEETSRGNYDIYAISLYCYYDGDFFYICYSFI